MNTIGVIAFFLGLASTALADGHCEGGVAVGDSCYFTVLGKFNLEAARQQCMDNDATLATIRTEEVFNAVKGLVIDNAELLYSSATYSVFWLDQAFDYESRELVCCDGERYSEASVHAMNMWYKYQPCMTKSTPDIVLVFRSPESLIANPDLEMYQGFYTINDMSSWNALCLANKK